MNNIKLIPLEDRDREQFILDNQEAFNYGALEEFGRRDDHFEEYEQIISRETIENMAAIRRISLHVNKGKTIAKRMAKRIVDHVSILTYVRIKSMLYHDICQKG